MKNWFMKKIVCPIVGHKFLSNHVGVIRCERCKLPWKVYINKDYKS